MENKAHGLPYSGFSEFWDRHPRAVAKVLYITGRSAKTTYERIKNDPKRWHAFKVCVRALHIMLFSRDDEFLERSGILSDDPLTREQRHYCRKFLWDAFERCPEQATLRQVAKIMCPDKYSAGKYDNMLASYESMTSLNPF